MDHEIPEPLRNELYAEPVLFVVREPRLISKNGASGGLAIGVLLLIGVAITFAIRASASPQVHIDLFGVHTTADTPRGQSALLWSGLAEGLLGVGLVALTPILRSLPGGTVVGTPTRILRHGRWSGVKTAAWRDFQGVKLGKDGSLTLRRYPAGRRPSALVSNVVEPPHPQALAEQITGLIQGKREEPARRDAKPADDASFTAAYRPGAQKRLQAYAIALVVFLAGMALVLLVSQVLLTGGTMTVSSNGGPPREVGARDPVAWVPLIPGVVLVGMGIVIVLLARPRRKAMRYVLTPETLVVHEGGKDPVEYPWRQFEGDLRRLDTRRGAEFRVPLRTAISRKDRSQAILSIVGVEDGDKVEAMLRDRLWQS